MCNVHYQRGCCEGTKGNTVSAQQSTCEFRVSGRCEKKPYSSLGAKPHFSLHWAPCCCASLAPASCMTSDSPVTCVTAMQAQIEADAAQVERGKLCSCKQLARPGPRSHQLMSVNGDESTSRLLFSPPHPQICSSELLHVVSCMQLCMKAIKSWRLKYLICLRGEDLLTQTRNYDKILFTREVWG